MQMTSKRNDPPTAPLKAAEFHILLALGNGPRHGYAIRLAVEELTAGAVKLWPATLYGTVRQLMEAGLIEPAEEEGPGEDARRIYYRLTPTGRDTLIAETNRLRSLVDYARATRALGDA
jgi:DNA-binding PadR family transcriptional regulator